MTRGSRVRSAILLGLLAAVWGTAVAAGGMRPAPESGGWQRVPEFDQGIDGSDPHVLRAGSEYFMYVSRRDPRRNVSTIWLWQSRDGLRWHREGQALDVGPARSWDATNAEAPTVLYSGGRFRMWYAGASGVVYQIGYAESTDGKRFVKLPASRSPLGREGLVLAPDPAVEGAAVAVADPSVVAVGAELYLYYDGFAPNALVISLATSRDGINWMRRGVVLRPDLPWEMANRREGTVVQPSVVHDGTRFHMVYATFSGVGHDVRSIGYASSTDGVRWVKPTRPALSPIDGERFFTGPSLLLEERWWNLYYASWWPDRAAADGVQMRIRLARRSR